MGNGGQSVISLMPDTDSTGSGSLLEQDACSQLQEGSYVEGCYLDFLLLSPPRSLWLCLFFQAFLFISVLQIRLVSIYWPSSTYSFSILLLFPSNNFISNVVHFYF